MSPDTRAMLVVARREFLERVRSKWFVVMTLLAPIGMVAMVVVPVLLGMSSTAGTRVDIVDQTGKLAQPIGKALEEQQWKVAILPPDTTDDAEMEKIRKDKINGFLTIPRDALDKGQILYRGDNASGQGAVVTLVNAISNTVKRERGRAEGIREDKLDHVFEKVNFDAQHTTGEAKGSSGFAAFMIAYLMAILLYIVITLYGVAVMRSVVTEKSSRVMEMLVAVVKPRALMAGKIIGIGGAGLTQIAIWLAMGALLLANKGAVIGWFGGSPDKAPDIPMLGGIDLVVVLAFFIAGFYFYSTMYAAVGAMVSSEQEMQQAQLPVTLVMVVGVVCLQVISNAPRGGAASVMSNIPMWSPMLMPMRYLLGGATLGEVAISFVILVITTLLLARAAGKIYRVGVLMYGKRPSLSEVIRWLRY